MKIAILTTSVEFIHTGSWLPAWKEYCIKNTIEYSVINPFKTDVTCSGNDFDVYLWHFGQYNYQEMLVARSILWSLKFKGKKIFPDFDDAWHFDDKLAESYLLQSAEAPIPNFKAFYTLESLREFTKINKEYPLVGKLRTGSGSHNVKLLRSMSELLRYGKRMLGRGYDASPSLFYKAKGNIQSSHNWATFVKRFKRIPEFLHTLKSAKSFSNERGYVYLQEFIPNDGYDIKVVVVGDKLSFIGREIRKGDFRASGGGSLFYDKSIISKNIIDSAFSTSDRLGFKCMGYDYVVDKRDGTGKIVEISYGFSHTALIDSGGYYDRTGAWHNEPLNAPEELLKNLLK